MGRNRNKNDSKGLFIEGETSEAIASLRQGFNKLFNQSLSGKMPKIYMGDGITTTIRKFKNNTRNGISFLLIDLDDLEENKDSKIQELALKDHSDNVFWMVQEMEAWFLSQPAVIDEIYGKGISNKITSKRAQLFEKPSMELARITAGSRKGKYQKVAHAVELLEKLDARQLRIDFPEFDALIKRLE